MPQCGYRKVSTGYSPFRATSHRRTTVPTINLAGRDIAVDEDGFVENPEDWDEEIAAAMALDEGIQELTDEHWKMINYLREYYLKFGIAPMIRKLCKDTGFKLKYVYELFPSGPAKGACKLAGLPKPTGCV